ncbi:hypothetical protein MRB53_004527 [Persea americana]|uniref:Uncharacterized protein n=1 Tax=Persea americana TaxID=3435 RepID=A0ACC2MBQ5_PERAE|nr:hypothetical protein MRB53_004527 [Persea americana]
MASQSRRPSPSLHSSSGSGNEGILARVSSSISQSSIVHQGMSELAWHTNHLSPQVIIIATRFHGFCGVFSV